MKSEFTYYKYFKSSKLFLNDDNLINLKDLSLNKNIERNNIQKDSHYLNGNSPKNKNEKYSLKKDELQFENDENINNFLTKDIINSINDLDSEQNHNSSKNDLVNEISIHDETESYEDEKKSSQQNSEDEDDNINDDKLKIEEEILKGFPFNLGINNNFEFYIKNNSAQNNNNNEQISHNYRYLNNNLNINNGIENKNNNFWNFNIAQNKIFNLDNQNNQRNNEKEQNNYINFESKTNNKQSQNNCIENNFMNKNDKLRNNFLKKNDLYNKLGINIINLNDQLNEIKDHKNIVNNNNCNFYMNNKINFYNNYINLLDPLDMKDNISAIPFKKEKDYLE